MIIRRLSILAAAVWLAAGFAGSASAGPFSMVFAVGDSIADSGNARLFFEPQPPDEGPAPPAFGYFMGRFSDGPNFVDLINQRVTGELATPGIIPGGKNFAVGGSRIIPDADLSPDLPTQVDLLLASLTQPIDPNALFIVHMGGNDTRNFFAGDFGMASADEVTSAAAEILGQEVQRLIDAGAMNILVAGVPTIETLPGFPTDPVSQAAARGFAELINGKIALELAMLDLMGAELFFLDELALFDALFMTPAAFGLPSDIDFNTPCLAVDPTGSNCDGFFFFDTIHPTAGVQRALAAAAIDLLGIPEPAVAWLLLPGLALLAVRRRRHQ